MKRTFTITLLLLCASLSCSAQWSAGLRGGVSLNRMSRSAFYTAMKFDGGLSFTSSITATYSFSNWLAVRSGVDVLQKNYTAQYMETNLQKLGCHEDFHNTYLQIPLMADFRVGVGEFGFHALAGVYGDFWLKSTSSGRLSRMNSAVPDVSSDDLVSTYDFSGETVEFNETRDNRPGFGLAGGVGVTYDLSKHWTLALEATLFYGLTSQTKDYMRISDPRYNTTCTIQAGVNYNF